MPFSLSVAEKFFFIGLPLLGAAFVLLVSIALRQGKMFLVLGAALLITVLWGVFAFEKLDTVPISTWWTAASPTTSACAAFCLHSS